MSEGGKRQMKGGNGENQRRGKRKSWRQTAAIMA